MLRTLAATATAALALTLLPTAAATAATAAADDRAQRAEARAATAAAVARGFYSPPADLSGRPGRVLKQQPTETVLTPGDLAARAQRLMYTSRGAHGERTAVTGTLLTPAADWVGPGERPLVSYAVGTQGMADRCAPSRQLQAGSEYESAFIGGLLARGYSVVVTDYEGLGTPGTHAYVNTVALGRNVLDAARAATRVATDAVPTSAPVYTAGYSEGGNASAGALEQAADYAPGLNLVGGYAGAVPADLAKVAGPLDGSLYAAFLLYSVAALDADYPRLGIADLLNAEGRRTVRAAEQTCTSDLVQFAGTRSETLTRSGRPITELLSRPDIARVLERLRVGDQAPEVPVLVTHTRLDDVVPFGQARTAARQWCAGGATVAFRAGIAPTHVGGAVESYPKALAWLEGRVQGLPAPSTC